MFFKFVLRSISLNRERWSSGYRVQAVMLKSYAIIYYLTLLLTLPPTFCPLTDKCSALLPYGQNDRKNDQKVLKIWMGKLIFKTVKARPLASVR